MATSAKKAKRSSTARARIYSGTEVNLGRLSSALARGELVAVPTETVYGLAANAMDPEACARIFKAKGRPTADPLIVHVHDWKQVETLATPNEAARKLAEAFWPGALTLVLPKKPCVHDIVTSGLPSVAIRMPAHRLFRRLLRVSGLPLAAPSANPFGYISPTCADHVLASLGKRIGHILDGGPCRIGVESTIIDLREPAKPRLLRPGLITREQIEAVLGVPVALGAGKKSQNKAQVAPGLLKRHYSPNTRLVLHDKISEESWKKGAKNEAWLLLAKPRGKNLSRVHWFDAQGRLAKVAQHLFAKLRELDEAGYTCIHTELAPGGGVADAINDRLRRAAAKKH